MANTFNKIATVTVGAGGVSSIDFTSIPATYTDLCVKVSARTTTSDGSDSWKYLTIAFNGASTNRSSRFLFGNGSTTGSASDTTIYAWVNGHNATANTFGNMEVYIPNYAGSTSKSLSADIVTENNATGAYANLEAGLWASSAAINQVTFNLDTGNFVQYSTATLYGISKS
jgi:hypothetical protein